MARGWRYTKLSLHGGRILLGITMAMAVARSMNVKNTKTRNK